MHKPITNIFYTDPDLKPDIRPAQQGIDGSDTMSDRSTDYEDDVMEGKIRLFSFPLSYPISSQHLFSFFFFPSTDIIRTASLADLKPNLPSKPNSPSKPTSSPSKPTSSPSKPTSSSSKPTSSPSKSTSKPTSKPPQKPSSSPSKSTSSQAPIIWPQPGSRGGHVPNPQFQAARRIQYERLIADARQVSAQQQMPGTFEPFASRPTVAFSGSSNARPSTTLPPSSPSIPFVATPSSSPIVRTPIATSPTTPVRNKGKQKMAPPSSLPYPPTKPIPMISPLSSPTKSPLANYSPTKPGGAISPPVSPSQALQTSPRRRVPLMYDPPVVRSDILAKDHAPPSSSDDHFVYYLPHPDADAPLGTNVPPHASRDPGLEKQTVVTLVTKGICPGIYFGYVLWSVLLHIDSFAYISFVERSGARMLSLSAQVIGHIGVNTTVTKTLKGPSTAPLIVRRWRHWLSRRRGSGVSRIGLIRQRTLSSLWGPFRVCMMIGTFHSIFYSAYDLKFSFQ